MNINKLLLNRVKIDKNGWTIEGGYKKEYSKIITLTGITNVASLGSSAIQNIVLPEGKNNSDLQPVSAIVVDTVVSYMLADCSKSDENIILRVRNLSSGTQNPNNIPIYVVLKEI